MNKRRAFAGIAALAAGWFASLGAYAAPTVSQGGLDVTITTSTSGQVVTITYLIEVGDALTAPTWIGTTMDALSIQFGCAGQNCNGIIADISDTATTSANVNGTWVGVLGKVSGNGCDTDNSETVCYTRPTTGTVDSGSETVLAANTSYSFTFDVTFEDGVDVADVLAGNHSIKFLSLKYNEQNGKWTTGDQLSKSGSFDEEVPVTEPGSLALLGLGLLGLGLTRRRRKTA